jgi:hypothetical protein
MSHDYILFDGRYNSPDQHTRDRAQVLTVEHSLRAAKKARKDYPYISDVVIVEYVDDVATGKTWDNHGHLNA